MYKQDSSGKCPGSGKRLCFLVSHQRNTEYLAAVPFSEWEQRYETCSFYVVGVGMQQQVLPNPFFREAPRFVMNAFCWLNLLVLREVRAQHFRLRKLLIRKTTIARGIPEQP